MDKGGKKLRVTNVYIPPIRQCKDDQREQKFEAEHLPWKDTDIIAGDMNAHAKEWDKTSSENKMGRDIAHCVLIMDSRHISRGRMELQQHLMSP